MIGNSRRKVTRNVRRIALGGMAGVLIGLLAACAETTVDDKDVVTDPGAQISVNETGEDSFRNPTPQGPIGIPDRQARDLTRRQQVHAWRVHGPAMATITAAAADGDMYLLIYERAGRRWSLLASNDDCGDGSVNACLENLQLADAEYLVVVSTYAFFKFGRPDAARYTLTTEFVGGAEGQVCGTRGAQPCADGMYCDFGDGTMCGAADQGGTCRVRPQMCTMQYDPVCGCDGHTYGNACSAASAGVDVTYDGVCRGDAGSTCGGIASLECNDGLYCNYTDTECDISDPAGFCDYPAEWRCSNDPDPQCGCDNRTYTNTCQRLSHNVGLRHEGACEDTGNGEGEMCGGIAGFMCAEGLVCDMGDQDYSDNGGFCPSDLAGTCRGAFACRCANIDAPVCGCDGQTYANDCMRSCARVAKAHDGACSF